METVAIRRSERELLNEEVEDWIRDAARGERFEPTVVWEHDGHEYTATFTRLPAEGSMDLEEAIVAISTERNGSRFSTQMRLRRLAFSHFAQFVDQWDPDVQIHDDEIGGRFHSNSEIYVSSEGGVKPLFRGKVTTARGVSSPSSSRRIVRRDMFLGGLETRAGRIPLPKPFESLGVDKRDDGAAHVFSKDTAITFYADGSYGFRPVESGGAEQRRALPAEPVLIAGAEDVVLHVEGVVNGQVLVYAPKEIVIDGDLVYAADPRRFPDSDDYLGLVSDGNVEVAPPDVTGPGDLEIDAAIYAKRRFVIDRYRHRERATLSIYGSLTAGSLSATEPRYRTRLEFDPRLEEVRPPRFPMTGRFEVASWNGEWTVEPTAEPTLAIE
ncbi:MAG TPA: hypothetical protein VF329_00580 [Gammaproteobacteria bacterium]